MRIRTALLAATLTLGLSGQAEAMTYNIFFDDAANGLGIDYFGSFISNPFDILTSFHVTIGLTHYSVINPGYAPPGFHPDLFITTYPGFGTFPGVITNIPVQAGALALSLYSDRHWEIVNCHSAQSCHGTVASGSYRIVATPLPAALPMLALGLGTLAAAGWRRTRKAKTAG